MRTFQDTDKDLNEDLWKIFGINIFKILVKIFQDLSFSCQDLQGSFIFLPRSSRTFHFLPRSLTILKDLNKNFENPWRSWQESKRSLKILARKPKILARKLEILTQFICDILESHPLIHVGDKELTFMGRSILLLSILAQAADPA